ncbi:MAG: chloride channel protein [Eggerthellaceae bacterium]|jgi:H+/Cl- antiporter ClcA
MKDASPERAAAGAARYVGNYGPGAGRRDIAWKLALAVLAFAIGFAAALAIRAVMLLISVCTHLLWAVLPQAVGLPCTAVVICTLGGACIGIWTTRFGGAPQPLSSVMAAVRASGGYRVEHVPASVIGFALPLVFGGAVGPEAGLAGLVATACSWVSDRLKRAGLRARALGDVGIAAMLAAVFAAPFAGLVAGDHCRPASDDAPDPRQFTFRRGAKLVLYALAVLGAFLGLRLFACVTGAQMGLPRFEAMSFSWQDVPWAFLLAAVGYALVFAYRGATVAAAWLSRKIGDRPVLKAALCGAALGTLGLFFPDVLFSGEEQAAALMGTWSALPAWFLLATGVLKAVATPLCLGFGWRGGHFFPCIFIGVTCGYGLAALTGADPVFCVVVTCGVFVAGVVRRPLLVVGLLLLCFPLEGAVWMIAAVYLGAYLPLPRALRD